MGPGRLARRRWRTGRRRGRRRPGPATGPGRRRRARRPRRRPGDLDGDLDLGGDGNLDLGGDGDGEVRPEGRPDAADPADGASTERADGDDATADRAPRSAADPAAGTTGDDGLLRGSNPADGADGVSVRPGFRLRYERALSPDAAADATYRLAPTGGGTSVAVDRASITLDLTRQSLSFSTTRSLTPATTYALVVEGLRTLDDEPVPPITVTFTTASPATATPSSPRTDGRSSAPGGLDGPIGFEREAIGAVDGPTSLVVGPDGDLYVTTFDGRLLRVPLDSAGAADGPPVTVLRRADQHFVGLAFEPGSDHRVWISQWAARPGDEFGSAIVAYDLATGTGTPKVTGLPRHPRGDHSVQSLAFRGGSLYASVGSVTTAGSRSLSFWGEPTLAEVPVSAAIIEIDYRSAALPVSIRDGAVTVDTGPVRLYATGLRNAYDLVWHSNGRLYANVNQNAGTGAADNGTPHTGPCAGLPPSVDTQTIADTLNLVRRGRYYGHPNPTRGECVVMGGGTGPFAVPGYDPAVEPDPDFDPSLIAGYRLADGSTGVSVNGIDEYRGPGPLRGALVSADFAGTRSILAVHLAAGASNLALDGRPQRLTDPAGRPLVFTHPLDVVSTARGDLYVADFGQWGGGVYGAGGSIVRLTPAG